MYQKHFFKFIKFFAVLIPILISIDLFARAGGAGGIDFGGGDGGDGIGIIIHILLQIIIELPFPANVIVAAIVILAFFIVSRISRKKMKEQTILNQLPTGTPVKKIKGYNKFIKNNPDFNEEVFLRNVETAFVKIQGAWEEKNLSGVRKFISDGVYQRFITQFLMMDLLQQENNIKDLSVKNVYIDKVQSDGNYDIIHTAIHASINDRFTSKIAPELNSGGKEEFVEYWTFLKKRGTKSGDLYNSDQCPNCGSTLPEDLGEISKCSACGTLTNSGEYDWVLSEITQADDYISQIPAISGFGNLTDKIQKILNEDNDFSIQLLEDKASNGYLQMLSARALNDPAIMKRFLSDKLFSSMKDFNEGERTAYNRLFLNNVYVLGISESNGQNHIHIALRSSYQRVSVFENSVEIIDGALISRTDVIVMSRDREYKKTKGSLYAHSCPSCGAPVENSLKTACDYCGSTFNNTSSEWIITELMSLSDYSHWLQKTSESISYSVKPSKIDKRYDVRDFALNNVMILLAADGVFEEEEREFAENLAKRWGYNTKKIAPFFDMAMSGSLSIKMPDDKKKRRKIYKLMKKAAMVDGNIADEEYNLLESIRIEFSIEDVE